MRCAQKTHGIVCLARNGDDGLGFMEAHSRRTAVGRTDRIVNLYPDSRILRYVCCVRLWLKMVKIQSVRQSRGASAEVFSRLQGPIGYVTSWQCQ